MKDQDRFSEEFITLSQASRLCPTRPSTSTVWRWVLNGVGGRRLESWKVGGRRVTTKEALLRFIEGGHPRHQHVPPCRNEPRAKAERELDEAGW